MDRWADPKVDRTEDRWVDPRVDRTEDRSEGPKVARTEGRSVGPKVDRMEGRWAVRKVDRREDRSVGPRVGRTGGLRADRWGVELVALTGRTEATSPEWMEQQAGSMPVLLQARGLQASRAQEAGRRRAPVPRPQAMSALPAA